MDKILADSRFFFDPDVYLPLGRELRVTYADASPFAHVVIDGLFPEEVLDSVLQEFPEPEEAPWQRFDAPTEVKLALADPSRMGPNTRHLLAEFNSHVFIEFLEELTGIAALVPDPHYVGGGLHQIRRGGFLKVHADFNRHNRLKLDRRLNVLLYLNRDWDESYGGHLELWDRSMSTCRQRILPVFNRMVVFSTTDFAYHGHPDPLTCPPHRARRSMALYYYSNGRPTTEVSSDHTTLFRGRPGESVQPVSLREAAKRWVPPAVTDALRSVKARRGGASGTR
jgi:Rps23 Pro-64 3,4-dihydroxylase Tpa1-like proline 4-hydroxylase